MIAATLGTPVPLPLLPTTGPKDWAGIRLATARYAQGTWDLSRPLFAVPALKKRPEFLKVEGATTVEAAALEAMRASTEISNGRGLREPLVAILQAKDGAFYISPLSDTVGSDTTDDLATTTGRYHDSLDCVHTSALTAITPHVDALKAIVYGSSWIRFPDAPAGSAPVPTPAG